MTIAEFLSECKHSLGRGKVTLMPAEEATYVQKLAQFNGEQLSAIYDKVLENTEYFPKIKNIYDAARELGFLATKQDDFRPHRWEETDCRLCKGEGRLCVTWIVTTEIRDDRRREAHALNQIRAYAESCGSDDFHLQSGEYRSLFRCSCLAGDAAGIPKAWPKWSKSIEPVRYA